MSTKIADLFGTGAYRGDRDCNADEEDIFIAVTFPAETAPVFHMAFCSGYRSLFFDKVREFYLHMCRFCIKLLSHFSENLVEVFDVDMAPVIVQYLDKTTHVSSLEMMGKIYIHVNRCVDMLGTVCFVENNNRIFNSLYAYLLYLQVSVIPEALNINHFYYLCTWPTKYSIPTLLLLISVNQFYLSFLPGCQI